jgi:long-chain acyl-CoA synthetase
MLRSAAVRSSLSRTSSLCRGPSAHAALPLTSLCASPRPTAARAPFGTTPLRLLTRDLNTVAGSYWPMDRDIEGLNMEWLGDPKKGVVIKPSDTLVDLWRQAAAAWPMRRFLATKMWVRGRLGYVWSSYEGVDAECAAMRTLLSKMGVARGTRIAMISENRYEWVVVHLAAMQLGAHFVAIPTNVTPIEARKIVRATNARVLIVETEGSYAAVKDWAGEVGELVHVLCLDDRDSAGSYAVALQLAESVPEAEREPVASSIKSEDTAMIMFTAGTTGSSKGVMLSHRCLVANISSVYAQLGESISHEDLFMTLAPWTIAGAMTVELYQCLLKGACMCIPPEILEGFQDLSTIHPSVVCSVALPFQRAYNNVIEDIMTRGKLKKDATRITISAITESRVLMRDPGAIIKTLSSVLLGKFKAQFGTMLRLVIIVGHGLTKDQCELLADLDLFVVNTYGCLEAGGILATDIDVPTRLKALPGVELRVVNEKNEVVVPGDTGEILVEAPHAMQGYFDTSIDPEEARKSLVLYGSRTFVRTGDYGSLTGAWLTVKGHKDVLITLDDGKVIEPLEIETELSRSPFIKQVFIFGDRRSYVSALIVPNTIAISNHLKKIERRDGVPIVSEREKAECVRGELRRVSANLPPRSHIRRFAFVDEFTQANGFMTCKWGLARQKIEAHYVHYINHLYDDTPKFYGYAVDDYDDLF